MLGHDVLAACKNRTIDVVAPTSTELDITDPSSVAQIAIGAFGDVDRVINCAAYTAVDKAESETDAATRLNSLAPSYLASACSQANIRVLHVSTDFVFDGEASEPYTEESKTNPLGSYGRTKREGEVGFFSHGPVGQVVRTSWLFGPNGGSFPKTMLRAWLAGKALRVVADKIGCPTYTADLAETLLDLALADAPTGIYHATGPDPMTWHEFTLRTLRIAAEKIADPPEISVAPISTSDWPTPARRPAYSVLSNAKLLSLGIRPMRGIDEALKEFVERLMELEPEMFERHNTTSR